MPCRLRAGKLCTLLVLLSAAVAAASLPAVAGTTAKRGANAVSRSNRSISGGRAWTDSATGCQTWTVDPTTNLQPVSVMLGIAAVSSSDAWSVGWQSGADRPIATLTQHWDGA